MDLLKNRISRIAVGTDFVLGDAVLSAPLLFDGNCKPTGLLVSSAIALPLRRYGYLVLNVFIQWSSRLSLFPLLLNRLCH